MIYEKKNYVSEFTVKITVKSSGSYDEAEERAIEDLMEDLSQLENHWEIYDSHMEEDVPEVDYEW